MHRRRGHAAHRRARGGSRPRRAHLRAGRRRGRVPSAAGRTAPRPGRRARWRLVRRHCERRGPGGGGGGRGSGAGDGRGGWSGGGGRRAGALPRAPPSPPCRRGRRALRDHAVRRGPRPGRRPGVPHGSGALDRAGPPGPRWPRRWVARTRDAEGMGRAKRAALIVFSVLIVVLAVVAVAYTVVGRPRPGWSRRGSCWRASPSEVRPTLSSARSSSGWQRGGRRRACGWTWAERSSRRRLRNSGSRSTGPAPCAPRRGQAGPGTSSGAWPAGSSPCSARRPFTCDSRWMSWRCGRRCCGWTRARSDLRGNRPSGSEQDRPWWCGGAPDGVRRPLRLPGPSPRPRSPMSRSASPSPAPRCRHASPTPPPGPSRRRRSASRKAASQYAPAPSRRPCPPSVCGRGTGPQESGATT